MDVPAVIVLVVVVALAAGTAGWFAGRTWSRPRSEPEGALPATVAVLDTLVADGIGRLRRWLSPGRDASGEPLTVAPDGTLTLLFSDIEGSTRINHDLGDDRFAQLLREHDRVVDRLVTDRGGRVVKTQGDGFLAAFHDPERAVRCALDLRDRLASDPDVGHPLALRLGLHTGRAVTTDADVFGQSVAFAARVAERADGGQVLVSDAVRTRVEPDAADLTFSGTWLPRSLKGVPGRHRLHRVDVA